MSSFECTHKEYLSLSLSELLIDEAIVDMVEANGFVFPDKLMKNVFEGTYKLDQTRLGSVMKGYNIGIPPILVKKALNGKFTVVNGRHRITATILNRCDIVPSIEIIIEK